MGSLYVVVVLAVCGHFACSHACAPFGESALMHGVARNASALHLCGGVAEASLAPTHPLFAGLAFERFKPRGAPFAMSWDQCVESFGLNGTAVALHIVIPGTDAVQSPLIWIVGRIRPIRVGDKIPRTKFIFCGVLQHEDARPDVYLLECEQ